MKYYTLILALILTGCSLDVDNPNVPICTQEFVYGLQVTVRDNTSNEALIEDILIIAKEGQYEEELVHVQGTEVFIGAGERPGNYIIEVTSPIYLTYTSNVIQVSADECHVIPEVVEILLQPN